MAIRSYSAKLFTVYEVQQLIMENQSSIFFNHSSNDLHSRQNEDLFAFEESSRRNQELAQSNYGQRLNLEEQRLHYKEQKLRYKEHKLRFEEEIEKRRLEIEERKLEILKGQLESTVFSKDEKLKMISPLIGSTGVLTGREKKKRLTSDQRDEIIRGRQEGESTRHLSQIYGVSRGTVRNIIKRRND